MTRYNKEDFTAEVQAMTNAELINRGAAAILNAAIMSGFSRYNTGKDDALCDAIYEECVRRGNVDLYQRAFNSVAESQGHTQLVQKVSAPVEVGEELRVPVAAAA